MSLRVLMFGETGQVAREILRRAPPGVTVAALGRGAADLARPEECAARIAEAKADVVVNAAAYTNVDRAEADREAAFLVNGRAPAAMAGAAATRGLPFLHISTDYVFDGAGAAPWRETDRPNPLNVYGASKLEGERGVARAGGPHVILRTSWIFSAHGSNFVKTMLRLAGETGEIAVVDDQRGGPTAAADIADALLRIAQAFGEGGGASGVFHYAGAPPVSWRAFAVEALAGRSGVRIRPIRSAEYQSAAPRPLNSVLDCSKIGLAYGLSPPDWRLALKAVLRELGEPA